MTLAKPKNTDILEFFYQHIDEDDWLEGLDLYQGGSVGQIKIFGDLVTAKAATRHHQPIEIRLKIHPGGKCIQWIECTCRKNRSTGKFCEHIAAFMIHMDREKNEVFAGLDAKMPIKPPANLKRVKAEPKTEVSTDEKIESAQGAAQKILSHLRGSIHSIQLIGKGPKLKIRLEIKSGQLTYFTLDTDDAAKFITSQQNLKFADPNVKNLKVWDKEPAKLGVYVYPDGEESIVAEKVIAVPHTKRSLEKSAENDGSDEIHRGHFEFHRGGIEGREEGYFELIPYKSVHKDLGKEYFYRAGMGYYPLEKEKLPAEWDEFPYKKTFKEDYAVKLLSHGFGDLASLGTVWINEELSNSMVTETKDFSEIKVHKEDQGWFYLNPLYDLGEQSVSMVDLMKHFQKKKRSYLKSGKKWIKIPDFIKDHMWNLDESGSFIKVDAVGLMRIKAAVGDFDHFVGSKTLINKLRNRTEFNEVSHLPELDHTKLNLREYQSHGYKWFWWLYQNGLHGLLADEMGLGKTHQAMALLSAIQKEKPGSKFLIVCPTTVLDHWMDKLVQYCPNLRPMKHHGPNRFKDFQAFTKNHDALVTSYGVLLRDIKSLGGDVSWEAVILDEAHFVKNNDTATYKAICQINGTVRLCLSGTPIENNLYELKSIFDFLVPGYLGSDEYFKKNFINPIAEREPNTELALQKLIHPFKMRRIKENVLKDLPAKVEDIRHCTLSAEQVKLYKNVLSMKASGLIKQLREEGSSVPYLHVFATLNLLKQICDHPALVMEDDVDYRKHQSDKFDTFRELLEEALGSGHKVVIFSQYLGMIRIFQQYLTELGVGHVVLTGQTRNRGEVINKFQTDPNCRVFCGSLLAGGIGIDLTAASVVIHYDRWWNASKESQATDRVHRIGQQKNVQVLKMVTRGTLEEKIDMMINSKRELFERFMDKDEEIFKKMDREQLIELLQ